MAQIDKCLQAHLITWDRIPRPTKSAKYFSLNGCEESWIEPEHQPKEEFFITKDTFNAERVVKWFSTGVHDSLTELSIKNILEQWM